ncbi:MAG TPA: SPOR domain-containing protein [Bacteroidales bacterium]|nr:SPOR domain-containing protein [Bacteroidales bacterium]
MKVLRLFLLFCLFPIASFAQETASETKTETIVDRINKLEAGKGSVKIIQDESITNRLGRKGKKQAGTDAEPVSYIEMMGFRIQVFAGNNQRISKSEAYTKESEVKSLFPELSTYVVFTAPFWRLRVGDFQTFQEAQRMMNRLRAEFPAFGREMSIIKEKVRVKVK